MQVTLASPLLRQLTAGFRRVIVRRRPEPPVPAHLLFEHTGGDRFTVTATDLDQTLRAELDGATSAPGEPDRFLVPFAELRPLASGAGAAESVTLHAAADRSVTVTSVIAGRPFLKTLDVPSPEEFPETWRPVPTAAYPAGRLAAAVAAVLPSASRDAQRQVLRGVFLHSAEHTVAATDGHRLTAVEVPEWDFTGDVILPPSKVFTSGVFAPDAEGALGVLEEDGGATLELASGLWRFQVRGLDGLYPDYRQVIPDEQAPWSGRITVGAGDLPVIRTAAGAFSGGDSGDLVLYADPDRVLVLSLAAREDGGRDRAVLAHSVFAGESPVVAAVSGRYLLEALAAGFTELRIRTGGSPWRCSGPDGAVHVLMPRHLDPGEQEAIALYVRDRLPGEVPPAAATSAPDAAAVPGSAGNRGSHRRTRPGAAPEPVPAVAAATGSGRAAAVSGGENDPLEELLAGIEEARDLTRQAAAAVRQLRTQARALERRCRAREREFESTGKLITRLQEAIGF
jgi:hypothetical protein